MLRHCEVRVGMADGGKVERQVANILGGVKNCRPLANASNCQVWEEGISEDFHTTCKLARMPLRVMPLLVCFYIAIEDESAQVKRDLGVLTGEGAAYKGGMEHLYDDLLALNKRWRPRDLRRRCVRIWRREETRATALSDTLANSVWSSPRHLQNEPSRRASRVQKGHVRSLQGRHLGCHRERGLGKEGRERLVKAKKVDQFRVHAELERPLATICKP